MMQVTKTPTYKAVQFFGVIATTVLIASCATITNDPNQQIEFVAPGCKDVVVSCTAQNKRGIWTFDAPAVVPIRRSDDNLSVTCKDPDGNESVQSIPSEIGGKIVASAIFLDFGIVDAITDKHREYPTQILLSACK